MEGRKEIVQIFLELKKNQNIKNISLTHFFMTILFLLNENVLSLKILEDNIFLLLN